MASRAQRPASGYSHGGGSGVDDELTQPLLHHSRMRAPKMHYLLMTTLFILLLGGLGIGAWLIVISGSGGVGPPDAPFEMVNRTEWGARQPRNGTKPLLHKPATHVVIIHTVTQPCFSVKACSEQVLEIQSLHMNHNNFSDIAYNFLVGGDGHTYEGRGWDTRGAFNPLMNPKALGIAFIGNFEDTAPPAKQLAEAKTLLRVSVKRKKLSPDYKLVGHCQVSDTESPGHKLYEIIKTWPHWEQCYKDTC